MSEKVKASADFTISVPGLPDAPKKWGAASKEAVVIVLRRYKSGPMRDFAVFLAAEKYETTEEEIHRWIELYNEHGMDGLRATKVQNFDRDPNAKPQRAP